MIKTFTHKGLRRFFEKSDHRGIPPKNAERIKRMLDRLDAATVPEDMNLPGYGFHAMRGNRKGTYSATITGNYRLTFTFDSEGAKDVDLEDYH